MTVGIGVVMLGRPSVGGMLHQMRARLGRGAPAVLAGHSGLATTALLVWACYLGTGWLALAWLAVCLLLPVIGLGMAVLTIGTAAASRPAGGAPVLRAGRRRRGAILPIVHGLAAMATILLALLTALGAG